MYIHLSLWKPTSFYILKNTSKLTKKKKKKIFTTVILLTVVQEFKVCFAMSKCNGFDMCNMFLGIRRESLPQEKYN